jgi:hypothetical protein
MLSRRRGKPPPPPAAAAESEAAAATKKSGAVRSRDEGISTYLLTEAGPDQKVPTRREHSPPPDWSRQYILYVTVEILSRVQYLPLASLLCKRLSVKLASGSITSSLGPRSVVSSISGSKVLSLQHYRQLAWTQAAPLRQLAIPDALALCARLQWRPPPAFAALRARCCSSRSQ